MKALPRSFLLGSLLVVCCFLRMAGGGEDATPAGLLSVSLGRDEANEFEFGHLSDAVLVVKNDSRNAILVLGFTPVNTGGEKSSLYGGAYGSGGKLKDEDAYGYNPLPQKMANLGFCSGLLIPGQEFTLRFKYRALSARETIAIDYVKSKKEYDSTRDSLAPPVIYIPDPGNNGKYVPFEHSRWLGISANCPASRAGPYPGKRSVVLAEYPVRVERMDLPVEIRIAGDFLSLEKARKTAATIAGDAKVEFNYSAALGGYVVNEGDSSWLLSSVDQAERGNAFPALPKEMLNDVDECEYVRLRIGDTQIGFGPEKHPADWSFWSKYPVYYGDGMYTYGQFIEIDKDNLSAFLKKARQKNCGIKVQKYFFGARYFELVDPQARLQKQAR